MRPIPDGFTGAVMGAEGVPDAAVLLHGPGGCRVRHMVHSSATLHRPQDSWDGSRVPYFYGYPRVPATYLDGYDFINGALYKLEEAVPIVEGTGPSVIVMVDSPGAGLIGDDHRRAVEGTGVPTVIVDGSLASVPVSEGFDSVLTDIMDALDPPDAETEAGTVNLLGLSILDKDWRAAREEMESLLGEMGLRVIATPGAGSSASELADSVRAETNVAVCPEMCAGLSRWYDGRGIRSVRSPAGAPVGFDGVRAWLEAVGEATGRDPSAAVARVDEQARRVARKFSDMRYSSARIRGTTFSLAATASVARPLAEWLYGWLSMAPREVTVDPGSDETEAEKLRGFLEGIGFPDAWGREPSPGSDVVLCDGVTAATMALAGECSTGIPIGHSSMGLDDVIPRPVYGIQGAMYILDEILHGVRGNRSHPAGLQQPVVQRIERDAERH